MRSSSRIEPVAAPAPGTLARALALRPREWADVAVAAAELAIARVRIGRGDGAAFLRPSAASGSRTDEQAAQVERVRLAVARAHHRVPWRADCLVQALAARRWLRRLGFETELCIGVPDTPRGGFEAHAWLMHGETVVTGGDVGSYRRLANAPGIDPLRKT